MILAAFCVSDISAVTISSLYVGTCRRETGVIIHVDKNRIRLLTLQGTVKSISRFDITYLAEYPVGNFPVKHIVDPSGIDTITIKLMVDENIVELIKGWPIDFSETSILFLSTDGDEIVVQRDKIYKIATRPVIGALELKNGVDPVYLFRHPSMFDHCEYPEADTEKQADLIPISPQKLIGDPSSVNARLERLREGFLEIEDYLRNQKFYAVPQVYTNDTLIGIWYNFGSRHGASKARTNNMIPFVITDYSDGPFGYQRQIITGTYLLPNSPQEEPQTQFVYRLKADYFHLSAMIDPTFMLIGSNYFWQKEDLDEVDHRLFEFMHIRAGFDLFSFSFELGLPWLLQGTRFNENFSFDGTPVFLLGFFYQTSDIKIDLYFGRNNTEREKDENVSSSDYELGDGAAFTSELRYRRLNVYLDFISSWKPMFSMILRQHTYERGLDIKDAGEFGLTNDSATLFFSLSYGFNNGISLSAYTSLEANNYEYYSGSEEPEISSRTYPKVGSSVMLIF